MFGKNISFKLLISIAVIMLLLSPCCNNEPVNYTSEDSFDSLGIVNFFKENKDSILNRSENYEKAVQQIMDTAKTVSENNFKFYFDQLSWLSLNLSESGNEQLSDTLSAFGLSLLRNPSYEKYLPTAYQCRGLVFWINGNADSALSNFEIASNQSIRLNNPDQLISTRLNIAMINKHIADSDSVINEFLELIELCEKYEKWDYMGNACNNLGTIYNNNKQHLTALEYFRKALKLYRKSGFMKHYLIPLNNISTIYYDLGMDSLALKSYQELKRISLKQRKYSTYIYSYINIALIYLKIDEPGKAFREVNEILEYLDSNDYPAGEYHIQCFSILGSVFYMQGKLEKSKNYFKRAIEIANNVKFDLEGVSPLTQLSAIYLDENKFDSALIIINNTLPKAEKYGLKENANQLSYNKAIALTRIKKFDLAMTAYRKAWKGSNDLLNNYTSQTTKDIIYFHKIQNEEAINQKLEEESQINEMMMINKEKTIKYQKLLIALAGLLLLLLIVLINIFYKQWFGQKTFNQKLRIENEFKNKLFSIVSHDIRSPLATIYNMFSLLDQGIIDEKVKNELQKDLLNKTEHTIEMIDNLLLWTKDQLNEIEVKWEDINIHELTDNIYYSHDSLNRASKRIKFKNIIAKYYI